MWTVVFESPNRQKVKRVIEILNKAGIMTMMKSAREDDFNSGSICEILVPPTELEAAQDIICDVELGG